MKHVIDALFSSCAFENRWSVSMLRVLQARGTKNATANLEILSLEFGIKKLVYLASVAG